MARFRNKKVAGVVFTGGQHLYEHNVYINNGTCNTIISITSKEAEPFTGSNLRLKMGTSIHKMSTITNSVGYLYYAAQADNNNEYINFWLYNIDLQTTVPETAPDVVIESIFIKDEVEPIL